MPINEQGSITQAKGTILPDDKWHYVGEAGEPSFQNSWVNYGGTHQTARFIKDAVGVVHVEGLVKSGTPGASSEVFTLPVSYRTDANLYLVGEGNAAFSLLLVESDGDVIIYSGSTISNTINFSFYAG